MWGGDPATSAEAPAARERQEREKGKDDQALHANLAKAGGGRRQRVAGNPVGGSFPPRPLLKQETRRTSPPASPRQGKTDDVPAYCSFYLHPGHRYS